MDKLVYKILLIWNIDIKYQTSQMQKIDIVNSNSDKTYVIHHSYHLKFNSITTTELHINYE